MTPFAELTRRRRLIETLRWFCVLPAAVLAEIVVQFMLGVLARIADSAGGGILGDEFPFRLILYFVLPKLAFVIAGARVAPRQPLATAFVLSALGLLFSLTTHVIFVQYLAGNRVGVVNFVHVIAESTGLLAGTAYIALRVRRNRRTGSTA